MAELEAFDPDLAKRPMIVGLGKMDLAETRELAAEAKAELSARGIEVFEFSAATGEGIEPILLRLESLLREHPVGQVARRAFPSAKDRPDAHGDGRPVDPTEG
jgi:GTP-binding protein